MTYIILAIIAITVLVLILTSRSNTKPKPLPEPTPEPTPEPPPPVLVHLYPAPPPMPTSVGPVPYPIEQQIRIGLVDDIGEAIRAAQMDVRIREIVLTESGQLKTPVVVEPFNRIRLMPGVVIRPSTEEIPFRMMEHSSIVGPGKYAATIFESSVPGQWFVVIGYGGSVRNGAPDFDILLYGFEVRGVAERTDFNSAPQAVALGNCKNCTAQNLWINGTHSIGVQLGGAGFDGNAAEDSKVIESRFTRVASQSLALVNGRRILFEHNEFDASGQLGGPGSHPIDVELNGSFDVAFDIRIQNNYIDLREAAVHGNGIIVQASTGSPEVGKIVIEDNVLIGGNVYPPVTSRMSNGIYVFGQTMRDVIVRRNKIWRTGQAGLNLSGSNIVAVDNELVNVGGGGIPGVILGLKDSEFSRNTLQYTGHGPIDFRIENQSTNLKMKDNKGFDLTL